MKNRSLPIRRTPVRKVSAKRRARSGVPGKLGIVRLYGDDLEALRIRCWLRDESCCQWPGCGVWCRWERGYPDSGHMAHRRNKQMYGDVLENVRVLCPEHHLVNEHNPKSVPRKQP
jgi:hypothetical protein